MKSIQTHATKSNLPMKLSTHAKKKSKGKKGANGDILALTHAKIKPREKKGQWRYFGFEIVSSVIVTKREKEREMKLGPTVR